MEKNQILFSKTRDVKSPTRAHDLDAGIDFFLPNDITKEDLDKSRLTTGSVTTLVDDKDIVIRPHGSLLISSGIKAIIPEGWSLIFFNKSGVSTKKHLIVGGSVVDAGYLGEIHIHLVNTSEYDVTVSKGEKVVQGILFPVGNHIPTQVDDIMEYTEKSERGSGGFGSSGTF